MRGKPGEERTDESTSCRGENPKALSQRALCPSSHVGQICKKKDAVCKAQAHEPKAETPAGLFGFAGDCTGVNLEQSDRMLFFFSPPAFEGTAQQSSKEVAVRYGAGRDPQPGKGQVQIQSELSQGFHYLILSCCYSVLLKRVMGNYQRQLANWIVSRCW